MLDVVYGWRLVLFAALIWAAIGDIRTYRIPNAIPILIVLLLVTSMYLSGAAGTEYKSMAISMGICLTIGFMLFAGNWMGAGDSKLYAAAAGWFEPSYLLALSLYIALAGVALSVVAIVLRTVAANRSAAGKHENHFKTQVPYGVAIMIGAVAAAEFPL